MPLKVRRFCTSFLLLSSGFVIATNAQTPKVSPSPAQTAPATQPSPTPAPTAPIKAPTSAEVMRERLSKAKAYIAVRNYSAAIYELENLRRETSDQSVNAVANVLLMNSYIEQGDYKRAQDFLNEFYRSYKSNSYTGNMYYPSVAAQVVKGARSQVDRYRTLGLMVSDRNLPLEAVNDIERMRELVEVVIAQAKEMSADKNKSAAAMALLEEATNSRSLLARDDYDARRWRDEAADSREQLASSRSVVINAVDGTAVQPDASRQPVAANTTAGPTPAANNPVPVPVQKASADVPVFKPVADEKKPVETTVAVNEKPAAEPPADQTSQKQPAAEAPKTSAPPAAEPKRDRVIAAEPKADKTEPGPQPEKAQAAAAESRQSGPLEVGSLVAYAVKQQAPVYPPAARTMRTSGVVTVEVTINEDGDVAEIQKLSGPALLQSAAREAIRKWKFKPFTRDGQPVKATGFVNFNFSL